MKINQHNILLIVSNLHDSLVECRISLLKNGGNPQVRPLPLYVSQLEPHPGMIVLDLYKLLVLLVMFLHTVFTQELVDDEGMYTILYH